VVLPMYDDNPTRRPALVTRALVAVNVLIFLLSPARWPVFGHATEQQLCAQKAFFQRYAAIPAELAHLRPLGATYGLGAGNHCELVARTYDKHVLLSPITYLFVHGGLLHLLGNMLFLVIFGNNVEDRLGRVRFLAFYMVVGVVSAYAYALTRPSAHTPLVGASGAIAGVLGAYLVLYPRAPVTGLLFYLIPLRLPAWVVLGAWFGIQAFYSRGTGPAGGEVAYFVHVVGFSMGVAYAGLNRRRFREPPPETGPGSEPDLRPHPPVCS
jgi:membrane associated rhomboid family serine protease